MMRKVKMALFGALLVTAAGSCKKAEKIETEVSTKRMVSTLAGTGAPRFGDGTGLQASFRNPQKMAIDATGNIYLADQGNHRIRKITQEGVVTTVAGSGEQGYADGNGTSAQFNRPTGIAIDGSGNLYIADSGNHCIRKISSSGMVSTLAGMAGSADFIDATGTEARFNYPIGLTIDGAGNILVADLNNYRIRKVTPSGVVTTFVGNGQAEFIEGPIATATMFNPTSVIYDPSSGNIYVTQSSFISKITPQGIISLVAGSTDLNYGNGYQEGPGPGAKFFNLYQMAIDNKGNLYTVDSENNLIRKIAPDGLVSTYSGIQYIISGSTKFKDGAANESYFARPQGLVFDKTGNLYVSENDGNRIRKISEVPIPDTPEEFARKNWNKPIGWK